VLLLVWYKHFRDILVKHAVAQLVEALRYKLKVVGSIPDGVIGMTGRTMAFRSIQPLTEMNTRNISWE
jgi:hypothetical protein